MTYAAERATIETRFNDQWADATPVGWDGHEFAPPTDEASVRVSILNGDSFNKSVGDPGNNVVRRAGVVMVEIFTPGGAGSAALRAMVDTIEPIFANWRSGGLVFRAMSGPVAVNDPPFYKATVSFPFHRDTFDG